MNRQGSDSAVQGFNDWEGGWGMRWIRRFFLIRFEKKMDAKREVGRQMKGSYIICFSVYCIIYIYIFYITCQCLRCGFKLDVC